MATTEELFISIPLQSYRKNKSAILLSQSELLQTLKHLQNLKVLSRQKNDLKIKLHKLFASIVRRTNSLQKKMPTSVLPKTVSNHKIPKPEKELIVKKTFSKRDEIEDELRLIQEKLQILNS